MRKHLNTPEQQSKDKQFRPHKVQFKEFFEYLQTHTATATMCAEALNIYRPNACRYKRWLQVSGHLWELGKSSCKITGFRAAYLTTDPNKAPKKTPQGNLFEQGGGSHE